MSRRSVTWCASTGKSHLSGSILPVSSAGMERERSPQARWGHLGHIGNSPPTPNTPIAGLSVTRGLREAAGFWSVGGVRRHMAKRPGPFTSQSLRPGIGFGRPGAPDEPVLPSFSALHVGWLKVILKVVPPLPPGDDKPLSTVIVPWSCRVRMSTSCSPREPGR